MSVGRLRARRDEVSVMLLGNISFSISHRHIQRHTDIQTHHQASTSLASTLFSLSSRWYIKKHRLASRLVHLASPSRLLCSKIPLSALGLLAI